MLWVFFPAAALFLLLLPGQNGGENEQSPDIVSVWEGHSISITCLRRGSESHMAMHLIAITQNAYVVYVSPEDPPYILPAFINHTSYSWEGRDVRITLHNVQESHSDRYQCIYYDKKKTGQLRKLRGKTTMVLVKAKKPRGVVEQSPLYANPFQGQSVTITCALRGLHKEIFLLKTLTQPEIVLHITLQNGSYILSAFANHLEYSIQENKIVVILHNLQKNDSDVYMCAGLEENSSSFWVDRSGTMIIIKEAEQRDCSNTLWGIYSLIIAVVLLFVVLVCCTVHHVYMKMHLQRKKKSPIYEDMSLCSRRNTLVRSNTCSFDN